MLRVFFDGALHECGGEIVLGAAESRHLTRVRRARPGDAVQVLDGRGGVAAGVLVSDDSEDARVRCESLTRHAPPPSLELAVGLPKGDLLGEIIRQATELGATALHPLLTTRTESKLAMAAVGRRERKLERWQTAATEACKQSGNPWRPVVHEPVELNAWLAAQRTRPDKMLRLVAALTPDAEPFSARQPVRSLGSAASSAALIVIGPEGDFAPEEYAQLAAAGFAAVRLPGHILRVETACVAALTVLAANK